MKYSFANYAGQWLWRGCTACSGREAFPLHLPSSQVLASYTCQTASRYTSGSLPASNSSLQPLNGEGEYPVSVPPTQSCLDPCVFFLLLLQQIGLLRWLSGKEFACLFRRLGFDPWVGKIPWRRAWQPTPVFLPGESHGPEEPGGLQSMGSHKAQHSWAHMHTHTATNHHKFSGLKKHKRIIFQF